MRSILSIVLLIAVLVAVSHAFRHRPGPGNRPPIQIPGTPPFNPHAPSPWSKPHSQPRFRRSPGKKNRITVEGQRGGGSSSYNVEYGRKIYENKHGSIHLGAGVNKEPFGRPQKHIGIQGQFRF